MSCVSTSPGRREGWRREGRPPLPSAHDAASISIFDRDWVWEDESGGAVRFSAWRGKFLVVGLVYTACTTVCPLSVEKMRHVNATFERAGRVAEYVLVTLDPMSDTSARLRRFKEARGLPKRWHLVRSTQEQTDALAQVLGLKTVNMGDHVIHEAKLVFVDPAGEIVGYVRG